MTNKINGIDVSEEIRYCNNCSNLGLDFKTGKFYCSLSHRPDELPEVLSCDEFSTNCYIKRLQEENKRLQMLSCANCGEKYLSPDGSELYDKNVQLQEENEKIKKQYNCYACGNCGGKEDYINLEKHHIGLRKQFDELAKRNNTLSLKIEELEKENDELKKYQYTQEYLQSEIEKRQKALEEIRTFAKPIKENTCFGMYCGFVDWILETINEVLEDSEDDTTINE